MIRDKYLDTMKTMRTLAVAGLLFILGAAHANEKSEDFVKAKDAFTKAIEKNNYRDAKGSLQELLPLMKQDLKDTKKNLSRLKKQGDQTLLSEASRSFKRKSEIFKELEHLVDISPAALRVKANQILKLVLEFDELVEII